MRVSDVTKGSLWLKLSSLAQVYVITIFHGKILHQSRELECCNVLLRVICGQQAMKPEAGDHVLVSLQRCTPLSLNMDLRIMML